MILGIQHNTYEDTGFEPRPNLTLALVCLEDIVAKLANPHFLAVRQVRSRNTTVLVSQVRLGSRGKNVEAF